MKLRRLLLVLSAVLVFSCFAAVVNADTVEAPSVTSTNVASTGKIKLTWDAVKGASKYKVYRATSQTGKYILMKTVTATSYTNSTAVAGKKYYYYVVAVKADGTVSKKSNTVSRVCDLSQPAITSISNVGETGKIQLSWSTVEGASKYKVYRSTSKNGTYTVLKTTTDNYYLNNNCEPGTLYYYKVRAIHDVAAGHSAFSAIKTRTCDLAQPKVTGSNVYSSGKVKLTWKEIDGAVSYKVYRSTSKNGTYSLMKTTTNTTYTNTTAVAEKYYYYKVRAISSNSNAHSAYSAVVGRTCDLPRTTVSVALDQNDKPYVTWTPVDGAVKYQVYRSKSKTGTYTLLHTTTGLDYTDPDVGLDTTYYYKVKSVASKTAANSALSLPASVTTKEFETRYVSLDQIFAYVEPSSSTQRVRMPYMAEFELGKAIHEYSSGNWYRIRYQGKIYYLWVEAGDQKFTETESSYDYTSDNPYVQEVLDLAKKICFEWDTHYVSGDSTGIPDSSGKYGFDCSGYVTYCINTVMKKYNPSFRIIGDTGTLYSQGVIYNEGLTGEHKAKTVSLDNLQPGDLLFFDMSGGGMNHVGIYMGNGELAHISSTFNRVTIMPLEGSFTEKLVRVRRFIPEEVTPANKTLYAKGSWVRMYAEPSSGSKVLHTFAKNEKATLLFVNANNSYGYVKTSSGKTGYVTLTNLSSTKV